MKYFLTRNFLLFLILFAAFLLRFWQLGQNPPSIFMDEASNGYNAYSILKTARDEYGNFLPLTFRAFGEYNPALSVYLLVPTIAAFDLNEFAIRLPSALFGFFTVYLVYLLVKKLLNYFEVIDPKAASLLPIASAAFLAVSPWHIQFSRYDHEANFMLFFSVFGVVLLLYSMQKTWFLPLAATSFGFALNSYHAGKVWIPLLLALLMFTFAKELIGFKTKLILPILILLISVVPFAINIDQSLARGQTVGILRSANPISVFTANYLSHYSPNFMFTSADPIGRHSVQGMGQLYVFEIPLILLGLITLIKTKGKAKILLLGWLLLAAVPASLATPSPHALRSIMFSPAWSIVSALGIAVLISSTVKKPLKTLLLTSIILVALYNFFTYLHLYYKHYPKLKARDWQDGYKQLTEAIRPVEHNYETIAVSNYFGRSYIFVLFFNKYDPAKYQKEQTETGFGKYEFFDASWAKTKQGRALVVTPPWQAHPEKIIKEIYAGNGELTFTISETE
jgi:4-amino-4-deoxy-L-arabinose transferase-like glycosyltransferase